MKFKFSTLATLLALICVAPASYATTLLPGAGPSAATVLPLPVGTVVALTAVIPFTTSSAVSGTFQEEVLQTSTGLDFLYYLTNNSTSKDALTRTTTTDFTGDLSADTVGFLADGNVAPVTVDRSLSGDTIGFSFAANSLLPGLSSDILVIETDATAFTTGSVFAIDGGVTSIAGYAPTPEPASVGLLLGGLFMIGMVGVRKFQTRTQQS